jgi:hypothetical protein
MFQQNIRSQGKKLLTILLIPWQNKEFEDK